MDFKVYHPEGDKRLAIPLLALQLSGLAEAGELSLRVERGCVVLTRPEPTAGELLESIRLLRDLTVSAITRLAAQSWAARNGPPRRRPRALRAYDKRYLRMLERCGVDLDGLNSLMEERGDE